MSRLIDADEAEARIDAKLNEFFAWGESDFGYRNACVAIKRMLISLPTVNEWIPVSEGLPQKGESVLVTLYDDLLSEWERRDVIYVEIAWYDERADYYDGLHFFDSEWQKLDTVTAWMPLPKPYEVEK